MSKIILNGKEKEVSPETSLQRLIGELCQDPNRVIAELNGTVVKSPRWRDTLVKDGDTLELVNFVGGG